VTPIEHKRRIYKLVEGQPRLRAIIDRAFRSLGEPWPEAEPEVTEAHTRRAADAMLAETLAKRPGKT